MATTTTTTPDVTFCPVMPLEDFTPCDLSELAPLIDRLETLDDAPVADAVAFPRGTLLPDGRLDLCKQRIGPAGAAAVAAALRGNRHVTAVLLGADGIGDSGAASVAGLIDANRGVRTAYLGCNGIGPAGVRAIADAVARGAPVTGLWLKRNPVGDEGAKAVADLLGHNESIRTLDLVNTQLGDAGLRSLCDVLAHRNRTVRRLYLGGNGIGPGGASALADVLRHNPSVRALLLSANRLGDAGAAALADGLRANRTLETLGLAANGIGPAGMSAVLAAARDHPSLVKLDLGYCASAPAVGATENRVGDAGVAAAADVLATSRVLRELDLRRTGLTADGLATLADALERNATLCRLTVAAPMPQALQARLRHVFARNRAAAGPIESDPDVLAIRSVYRS